MNYWGNIRLFLLSKHWREKKYCFASSASLLVTRTKLVAVFSFQVKVPGCANAPQLRWRESLLIDFRLQGIFLWFIFLIVKKNYSKKTSWYWKDYSLMSVRLKISQVFSLILGSLCSLCAGTPPGRTEAGLPVVVDQNSTRWVYHFLLGMELRYIRECLLNFLSGGSPQNFQKKWWGQRKIKM